jgi:hypothetical protein
VRRITTSLKREGIKIGKHKVRQIMKEEGLKAIGSKAFKPRTTDSRGTVAAPHLLKNIKIEEWAPAKIIIGDIIYIPLPDGSWCYTKRKLVCEKIAEARTK